LYLEAGERPTLVGKSGDDSVLEVLMETDRFLVIPEMVGEQGER
jgi:hypothetical protein